MMGPQEDYVETVLTCKGDYYDPDFHVHLEDFSQRLEDLLVTGKQSKLILKKVEPWNSVRVTFNIPKEAAFRLKQLAEQGSKFLRDLGILAVQIEGDCLTSLTIAGKNNETTELVFRTSNPSEAPVSTSMFDVSSSDEMNVPGPSNVDATRKNIAQYLSHQGGYGANLFDSILSHPTRETDLKPQTVSTSTAETQPVRRKISRKARKARAYPPSSNNEPLPVPSASVATQPVAYLPASTPQVSNVTATGQKLASPVSPKLPTPPPSGPISPGVRTSGGYSVPFPHGNPNVNNIARLANKDITSSSPLLVNLLQTDASGAYFNNLLPHAKLQLSLDGGSVPKKKRRAKKPKGDGSRRSKSPDGMHNPNSGLAPLSAEDISHMISRASSTPNTMETTSSVTHILSSCPRPGSLNLSVAHSNTLSSSNLPVVNTELDHKDQSLEMGNKLGVRSTKPEAVPEDEKWLPVSEATGVSASSIQSHDNPLVVLHNKHFHQGSLVLSNVKLPSNSLNPASSVANRKLAVINENDTLDTHYDTCRLSDGPKSESHSPLNTSLKNLPPTSAAVSSVPPAPTSSPVQDSRDILGQACSQPSKTTAETSTNISSHPSLNINVACQPSVLSTLSIVSAGPAVSLSSVQPDPNCTSMKSLVSVAHNTRVTVGSATSTCGRTTTASSTFVTSAASLATGVNPRDSLSLLGQMVNQQIPALLVSTVPNTQTGTASTSIVPVSVAVAAVSGDISDVSQALNTGCLNTNATNSAFNSSSTVCSTTFQTLPVDQSRILSSHVNKTPTCKADDPHAHFVRHTLSKVALSKDQESNVNRVGHSESALGGSVGPSSSPQSDQSQDSISSAAATTSRSALSDVDDFLSSSQSCLPAKAQINPAETGAPTENHAQHVAISGDVQTLGPSNSNSPGSNDKHNGAVRTDLASEHSYDATDVDTNLLRTLSTDRLNHELVIHGHLLEDRANLKDSAESHQVSDSAINRCVENSVDSPVDKNVMTVGYALSKAPPRLDWATSIDMLLENKQGTCVPSDKPSLSSSFSKCKNSTGSPASPGSPKDFTQNLSGKTLQNICAELNRPPTVSRLDWCESLKSQLKVLEKTDLNRTKVSEISLQNGDEPSCRTLSASQGDTVRKKHVPFPYHTLHRDSPSAKWTQKSSKSNVNVQDIQTTSHNLDNLSKTLNTYTLQREAASDSKQGTQRSVGEESGGLVTRISLVHYDSSTDNQISSDGDNPEIAGRLSMSEQHLISPPCDKMSHEVGNPPTSVVPVQKTDMKHTERLKAEIDLKRGTALAQSTGSIIENIALSVTCMQQRRSSPKLLRSVSHGNSVTSAQTTGLNYARSSTEVCHSNLPGACKSVFSNIPLLSTVACSSSIKSLSNSGIAVSASMGRTSSPLPTHVSTISPVSRAGLTSPHLGNTFYQPKKSESLATDSKVVNKMKELPVAGAPTRPSVVSMPSKSFGAPNFIPGTVTNTRMLVSAAVGGALASTPKFVPISTAECQKYGVTSISIRDVTKQVQKDIAGSTLEKSGVDREGLKCPVSQIDTTNVAWCHTVTPGRRNFKIVPITSASHQPGTGSPGFVQQAGTERLKPGDNRCSTSSQCTPGLITSTTISQSDSNSNLIGSNTNQEAIGKLAHATILSKKQFAVKTPTSKDAAAIKDMKSESVRPQKLGRDTVINEDLHCKLINALPANTECQLTVAQLLDEAEKSKQTQTFVKGQKLKNPSECPKTISTATSPKSLHTMKNCSGKSLYSIRKPMMHMSTTTTDTARNCMTKNFMQKSLTTSSKMNSAPLPMTEPFFPLSLTESVKKVIKAIPHSDTTPPASPKKKDKRSPFSTSSPKVKPIISGTGSAVSPSREVLGELKSVVVESTQATRVVKAVSHPFSSSSWSGCAEAQPSTVIHVKTLGDVTKMSGADHSVGSKAERSHPLQTRQSNSSETRQKETTTYSVGDIRKLSTVTKVSSCQQIVDVISASTSGDSSTVVLVKSDNIPISKLGSGKVINDTKRETETPSKDSEQVRVMPQQKEVITVEGNLVEQPSNETTADNETCSDAIEQVDSSKAPTNLPLPLRRNSSDNSNNNPETAPQSARITRLHTRKSTECDVSAVQATDCDKLLSVRIPKENTTEVLQAGNSDISKDEKQSLRRGSSSSERSISPGSGSRTTRAMTRGSTGSKKPVETSNVIEVPLTTTDTSVAMEAPVTREGKRKLEAVDSDSVSGEEKRQKVDDVVSQQQSPDLPSHSAAVSDCGNKETSTNDGTEKAKDDGGGVKPPRSVKHSLKGRVQNSKVEDSKTGQMAAKPAKSTNDSLAETALEKDSTSPSRKKKSGTTATRDTLPETDSSIQIRSHDENVGNMNDGSIGDVNTACGLNPELSSAGTAKEVKDSTDDVSCKRATRSSRTRDHYELPPKRRKAVKDK